MPNTLTLDQDRTMHYLITTGLPITSGGEPVTLADGDTIDMNGHNLIVDMITCGSVDPDASGPGYGSWEHRDISAYNIGVKIINTPSADCNLEFKDWSGIRLNQSGGSGSSAYALPPTVHPYIDPANQLPVAFEGEGTEISTNQLS